MKSRTNVCMTGMSKRLSTVPIRRLDAERDDLKRTTFKSFVQVKVEIAVNGSFTQILRPSSGNPEIDARMLSALERWTWKPELKDGVPVRSAQLFKFKFEVEQRRPTENKGVASDCANGRSSSAEERWVSQARTWDQLGDENSPIGAR
jgi:hypothetical protein